MSVDERDITVQVKDSIDTMLDCFGGADGGHSFVKLKVFMEATSNKVDTDLADSDASEALCLMVIRMGKLIKTVSKL